MRALPALVVGLLVLGSCGDTATETPAGPGETAPPVHDASAMRVQLHAGGSVILLEKGSHTKATGMVNLAAGSPRAQAEALVWLREQLVARTADPATREPDLSSRLWFELELDPDARWQYAQWILQVGAEPTVGLYKIRYLELRRDDPVETFLPRDPHIEQEELEEEVVDEETGEIAGREPGSPDPDAAPRVRVKLFRRNADDPMQSYTRVRIGDSLTFELPRGPVASPEQEAAYAEAFGRIQEALRGLRDAAGGSFRCRIMAPPPSGFHVPCRDILYVLRAVTALGADVVTLDGAPAPMPR